MVLSENGANKIPSKKQEIDIMCNADTINAMYSVGTNSLNEQNSETIDAMCIEERNSLSKQDSFLFSEQESEPIDAMCIEETHSLSKQESFLFSEQESQQIDAICIEEKNPSSKQELVLSCEQVPKVINTTCSENGENRVSLRKTGLVIEGRKSVRLLEKAPSKKDPIFVKNFQCVTCLKTFTTKESLSRHDKRSHGFGELICDTCGSVFRHRDNFKQHYPTHLKHKPSKKKPKKSKKVKLFCDKCKKTFTKKIGLKRHMLRFHPSQ